MDYYFDQKRIKNDINIKTKNKNKKMIIITTIIITIIITNNGIIERATPKRQKRLFNRPEAKE